MRRVVLFYSIFSPIFRRLFRIATGVVVQSASTPAEAEARAEPQSVIRQVQLSKKNQETAAESVTKIHTYKIIYQ